MEAAIIPLKLLEVKFLITIKTTVVRNKIDYRKNEDCINTGSPGLTGK